MSSNKLRVVHYVNQFFGQEGQEDKAGMGFMVKDGPVGPGVALQKALGDAAEVVATVICGDNYFAENLEKAALEGTALVADFQPDLVFAGPAFAAGRYGLGCGALCKAVQKELGVPAITGMYQENPAVGVFKKDVYIIKSEGNVRGMVPAINDMTKLALRLLSGQVDPALVCREPTGNPERDNYFLQGICKNHYTEKTAAGRAVDLLLLKLAGQPFESEVPPPDFEPVTPPEPIKDLSESVIAIVSDGGLVPRGNPDKLSTANNKVWVGYDVDILFPEKPNPEQYEIIHTGYFHDEVMADPNRLAPVQALREMEREGVIGKLNPIFYSTGGNASINKRCSEMGEEMVSAIRKSGVDAVILTSTWGSSTRCGSAIASQIEMAGIPTVQITPVPVVATMVGVNRILRGAKVTNVVGDSSLPPDREKKLMRRYAERSLEILQTDIEESKVFTLEDTE